MGVRLCVRTPSYLKKMLRSTIAALATALVVLALPTTIEAHGSMSNPMPKFKDIYNLDAPSASMPGPAGPYQGNDELKALAEKAGSRCGQTDPNHVQPIPTNGALQFKITAVHIGFPHSGGLFQVR
ncbi:hypothetical protein ATCC90586_011202 [Pythium insidiosum]|nr:hypothetical protein ATCC90586_011202 [Pythium insidiosum]